MTRDTCLYTVTSRSEKGSSLLREYVHEQDVTTNDVDAQVKTEESIGSESEYKVEFTIKLCADSYEIPVIEEGMAILEDIEVEDCEVLT